MKRKRIITAMLLAAITLVASADVVQHPKVVCEMQDMIPMAYPSRVLTSDYTLELRNDSAIVHLPYIGVVYTPTMSNEGYNFAEPYRDMTAKATKKGDGTIYDFTIKHDIVDYCFQLTLWDNNYFFLTMQPSNAQSCSYNGSWSSPKKTQCKPVKRR